MEQGKEALRLRFESQTDIVLVPHPEHWQEYAEWLEELAVNELNNELMRENELLRNKMQEAMNALEQGITGAYSKKAMDN
jgi:hypothetical protein